MPWLQLHILTTPKQAHNIEQALLKTGANAVTFVDNADQPILEPGLGETPLWQDTKVVGLYDAEIQTARVTAAIEAALKQPLTNHKWEQLEDKDWQREWMEHYQPIQCGEGLWICPSWKTPPDPTAVNVMLDPGLAFGTGTHPTTLLCLQWLEQQDVSGLQIMDYGCGSGILGIAALMMGAKQVMALDIDPQALIASLDNAERNGIRGASITDFANTDAANHPQAQIITTLPTKNPEATYELVFANILAGPLVELAESLTRITAPGGRLCLSGILDSQADSVMAAYSDEFIFEPIRDLDHWVQLAATRRGHK